MKRPALILSLCLIALLIPSALQASSMFADVEGNWAEESIGILRAHGLILGYEDGLFRPERHVSRAEAAKVVVILLGWEEEAHALARSPYPSRYGDMRSDHWAFGYVEMASDLRLFIGDERGWFRPEASITRAELVTVLGRMLGALQEVEVEELPFPDIDDIPWWTVPSLYRVVETGMVPVREDSPFSPQDIMDRSTFVDYIRKYMRYCGCDFDFIAEVAHYGLGEIEVKLQQKTVRLDLTDVVSFRNGLRGSPRPYDQVGVILDGDGQLLHLSSYFTGVEGVLVSHSGNLVTVRSGDDLTYSYTVQAHAPIYRNGARVFLSDLRVGDEVLLVLDYRDGSVRAVDAVTWDGRGVVSSVGSGGRVLTIRREGVTRLLLLDDNTQLLFDGSPGTMEEIEAGMTIRYREGGQYVQYAELSSVGGGD